MTAGLGDEFSHRRLSTPESRGPVPRATRRFDDDGRGERRCTRGRKLRRRCGTAGAPRGRHDHALLAGRALPRRWRAAAATSCATTCAIQAPRPPSTPRLRPTRCATSPMTLQRSLRTLDHRPAHLAGIGVGGMVAQVAALNHPESFCALTLVGTRPVAPGPVDDDLPDHDAEVMDRLLSRAGPDWSDRAAVADFVAAERRSSVTTPRLRVRPPSAGGTVRRAQSPPCRWPTTWVRRSAGSTAGRAGGSGSRSSPSRRSSSTVAATSSSPSATAKPLRARSRAHDCSCSRMPQRPSPVRHQRGRRRDDPN